LSFFSTKGNFWEFFLKNSWCQFDSFSLIFWKILPKFLLHKIEKKRKEKKNPNHIKEFFRDLCKLCFSKFSAIEE
jgi:hypothetical protein